MAANWIKAIVDWVVKGLCGGALFFSLFQRMIISITVLLVTRILLNCNWGFSLEAAFFSPFLSDLIDFFLSAMDRIPLSVGGDGSGPSFSKRPSFDLNVSAAEQAVYELMQQEIKGQKQRLADLLNPLIQTEAEKYPNIRKLPSPRDMVEELIKRLASTKVHQENEGNAANLKNLKTWLTRAEDETKGRMSIRSEIRAIIQEYSQNDSENSLSFPPHRRIIGTPTPGRVSEPCNRRPFRAVRWALESAAGARQRLDPHPIFGPIPPSYYQKMRFLPNPSLLLQPLPN